MDYVKRRSNYFMLENGEPWTPIGFNESVTWPSLSEDPEKFFIDISSKGINCLRMFFEYAETQEGLLESRQGIFNQINVNRWKIIFELAERYNVRLLMAPYDTFWQWKNWDFYPYNSRLGGYLNDKSEMLTHPKTLEVHKTRFKFLIENFSNSGVLFGWDLWNEIHPSYSRETADGIDTYISEMSQFVRNYEIELFGKSHLQTCSFHGPDLFKYPKLKLTDHIFRNKFLDFADLHIYDDQTISQPKNTVDSAVTLGLYIRESLKEIKDGRPFLCGETGPMNSYEQKIALSNDFDNEYFYNMSWAHLCSGGSGAGMRWPYRHPHQLTDQMYETLSSVSEFSKIINWNKFNRENLSDSILFDNKNSIKLFACGTDSKFLIFILRSNLLNREGFYEDDQKKPTPPINVKLTLPNVSMGNYKITSWKASEKKSNLVLQNAEKTAKTVNLTFGAEVRKDLILYIEKNA